MQSIACVHAVTVLKSFQESTQYQRQHLYFLCWLNFSSPENKQTKRRKISTQSVCLWEVNLTLNCAGSGKVSSETGNLLTDQAAEPKCYERAVDLLLPADRHNLVFIHTDQYTTA